MAEDLSLKLYYFHVTAKGEPIRLLLHYLGIAFEDYRLSGLDELNEMRESGKLMFGQVPALEITNKKDNTSTILTQTSAILRYVAKLGQSATKAPYPSDKIQAALIDAITDQESDCFSALKVAFYKERFGFGFLGEEQHKPLCDIALKNQKDSVIPHHLEMLQKQLDISKTGWIAGTEGPSIADFTWLPSLKWFGVDGVQFYGGFSVLDINAFPSIKGWSDKFYQLAEVKDWYAKH